MVSAPSIRKQRREAERAAAKEARRAALGGRRPPLVKAALALGILLAIVAAVMGVRAWLSDPLARGRDALAAGNYRSARIDLMNAVAKAPGNVAARIDLAHAYNGLRRGTEAERQLQRAVELGASAVATRAELAEAQLLQGRAANALETLAAGCRARCRARAQDCGSSAISDGSSC